MNVTVEMRTCAVYQGLSFVNIKRSLLDADPTQR